VESHAQVEAAITKAQRRGIVNGDPQVIIEALAKRYQAGCPPRDAGAYTYSVAQNLARTVTEPSLPQPPSKAEPRAWAGLCFCWPSDSPSNFIRVDETGFCEQVTLENGEPRHGYAPLGRSKLLVAIWEERLKPVSADVFEDLVRGARA
jgi:hypothetical protein